MEAEHAALGPLLEAIDDALDDGQSAPDARAELSAQLHAHLRHEEETALPVIDCTLDTQQWLQFGEAAAAKIGRDMPYFLPWLLDGANAERTKAILGNLPESPRRHIGTSGSPPTRRRTGGRREPRSRRGATSRVRRGSSSWSRTRCDGGCS
jgi:hypothetical protein